MSEDMKYFMAGVFGAFLAGFGLWLYFKNTVDEVASLKAETVAARTTERKIKELLGNIEKIEKYSEDSHAAKINAVRDYEDVKTILSELKDIENSLKRAKEISKAFDDEKSTLNQAINNPDFVKAVANHIETHPIGSIIAYPGELRGQEWNRLRAKGWRACDGTLLLKSSYPELYYILGEMFLGGKKSKDENRFSLPDLRGKTLIGFSSGNIENAYVWKIEDGKSKRFDISKNVLGATIGEEKHILTIPEMPSHDHKFSPKDGSKQHPFVFSLGFGNTHPAQEGKGYRVGKATIQMTGESKPHNNMQPSLVVNFIIKAK